MSTTELERQYHCWNDCSQSGCPGHTATLSFQSTSDSLYYSNGKGSDIYMQPPELEAFLAMLHEVAEARTEISSVLDRAYTGAQVIRAIEDEEPTQASTVDYDIVRRLEAIERQLSESSINDLASAIERRIISRMRYGRNPRIE